MVNIILNFSKIFLNILKDLKTKRLSGDDFFKNVRSSEGGEKSARAIESASASSRFAPLAAEQPETSSEHEPGRRVRLGNRRDRTSQLTTENRVQ